jgi:CheY-like chemotaxis protein
MDEHDSRFSGRESITGGAEKIAALEEALAKAEDANRKKTAFIANLSHEIRTPLNSIVGVVNLFQGTKLDLEQKKFVEMLSSSARDLLSLVEELLDLSRIETGRLELKIDPVPLRSCCSQAVRPLAMAAQERRLQMELSISPAVPEFLLGDSARIRQVLRNLVNTAITFTAKGKIEIQVFPLEDGPNFQILQFSVSHSAEGISGERLGAMLDYSGLNRSEFSRAYEGAGLGLIIARGIVEAMGGKIWTEIRKGDEHAFHFTLKMDKLAGAEKNAADSSPEKGKESNDEALLPAALSILVVDDNKFNRSLTRTILRKKGGPGWAVSLAESGQEALEKTESEAFDLVFMDIQMPEMDGLETTRIIRGREKGTEARLAVIAMTAYAMEGDRQMCLDAGMDDYIAKPVDPEELVDVIIRNLPLISSPKGR